MCNIVYLFLCLLFRSVYLSVHGSFISYTLLEMNQHEVLRLTQREEKVFDIARKAHEIKDDAMESLHNANAKKYKVFQEIKRSRKVKSKRGRLTSRRKALRKMKPIEKSMAKARHMLAKAQRMKKRAIDRGGAFCRDRIIRGIYGLQCDRCKLGRRSLKIISNDESLCPYCFKITSHKRRPASEPLADA